MARKALVAAICILALLFVSMPFIVNAESPGGNGQTGNPTGSQYQTISGQEVTGAESSVPLNYTGQYVTNQNLSYPYFKFNSNSGSIANMPLLDRMWRNAHLGTMGRAYEGDTSHPDWILPTEYTDSAISMRYWADVNSIALNQTLPGTHLKPRFWDLGILSPNVKPNNYNIGPQKQSNADNTGGSSSKNASTRSNQTKRSGSDNSNSESRSNTIAGNNNLNIPGIGNIATSFPRRESLSIGSDLLESNVSWNNTSTNRTTQSNQIQNTGSSNSTAQQSEGYVPLGGTAGLGSKIEGAKPHENVWIGAPSNNPWVYGPSAYPRMQVRNFWRGLNQQVSSSSSVSNKT